MKSISQKKGYEKLPIQGFCIHIESRRPEEYALIDLGTGGSYGIVEASIPNVGMKRSNYNGLTDAQIKRLKEIANNL